MWNRVIKSITIPIFLGLMLLFSVGFKSVEVCCACICTQIAPKGCPLERLDAESFAGRLLASLPNEETTTTEEQCTCDGGEECSDCIPKIEVLHVDSYTPPKESFKRVNYLWITLSEISTYYITPSLAGTSTTFPKIPTHPAPLEGRSILTHSCVLRI
ncbi:hypothetical protein HQ36_01120 [Porphyromonas gingivicanis]|uniref:Uncharacterized protein n=1 Tax=Porphyromonas gingivicanis TaxID=266762 RepID=A0A0A2G765_9PORP|nr:hypothetical protein [Porphyromonas gingivicanis]KGN99096.1 hypothetical protein HQ36_01120 [Porphyromonas gingivicanis]